jgi:uncharacterized protein YraI
MVTTKNLMNLRASPDTSSAIIRQIPYNVTLTAFARQGEWFNVDYLGTAGWLNAAYVMPDGACGP